MVATPWASKSKDFPVTGSRSFESHLEGHAPRDNSFIRIVTAVSRSGRLANMNSTRGSDGSWSRFNPRTPLVLDRIPEVLEALEDDRRRCRNRPRRSVGAE